MKSIKSLSLMTLLIITLLFLSACKRTSASSTLSTPNTNTKGELFNLKIYSDKLEYKTTEKINIWSTFEYIGEDNQIKIWHGEPYIIYSITDGKDFKLEGIVLTVLKSTLLDKGKIYKFDYVKSGGFSADDPKAEFWKKFFSEKDLYLPAGEYTIKVATGFSLGEDVVDSKIDQTAELKIRVVE